MSRGWRGGKAKGVQQQQQQPKTISMYAYEHEAVKSGIRELLMKIEPLVKVSGGSAPLESMMTYLEELDDSSFEKYLLVKHIKAKLKASLFQLVQAEVQLQCKDTLLTPEKMKIVAPAILSKLMTSTEMEECLEGLHSEVGDAASEMCTNFDRELVLMAQMRDSEQQQPLTRNNSSLSDSLSSTWNQSGFVFIQPSQYAKLADKLNQYKTVEERLESLNTILASQVGECVGAHCWSSIKEGIQAALMDGNPSISSTALRVFSRMLTNVTPFCTKEAFVSLTSAVVGIYKDKTRSYLLPAVASEVSYKRRPNYNLLQVCRLIVATCKDLPKYWTRYPSSYIEEIMRAMLEVVTLKSRGQKSLSPIHLLSLVDPNASWLKAWLHGNIGRQIFFSLSQSNHDHLFFKTGIHHLLVALERDTFPLLSRSSGRKKGLLSSSLVSFAFFSHNLNVTCFAIKYTQGQKMFPIILPNREEPILPNGIMKSLVSFVSHGHQLSHQAPSKMITKALISSIGQSDMNVMKFWINDKIIDLLVAPLLNYQQIGISINLFKLLQVLLASPIGMNFARNVNIESTGVNLPDFILDFATRHLKSIATMTNQSEVLLLASLKACGPIVKNYYCVLSKHFEDFINALTVALFELDDLSAVTPTNSMANLRLESHSNEVKKELIEVLKLAASTPRGMYVMADHDGIFTSLVQDGDFPVEKLALSIFTVNGKLTLEENAFVETSKKMALKLINEQETAKMWQPTPQTYEENITKILVNLITIISDLDSFDTNLKAIEEVLPLGNPLNFATELDSFTLKLFKCLMSDLDLRLHFMARFDLATILQQLSSNCINEDGTTILDSNSFCILDMMESLQKGIGGPSERKVITGNVKEFGEGAEKHLKPTEAHDLVTYVKEHKAVDNHVRELFKKYSKDYELSEDSVVEIISALLPTEVLSRSKPQRKSSLTKEELLGIDLFSNYRGQNEDVNNAANEALLASSSNLDGIAVNWSALVLNNILRGNIPKVASFSSKLGENDDHYLVSKIGHLVELILHEDFPMILPRLKSVNISVSAVARRWINQSFLNVLNWPQILHYLLLQLIFGSDYTIYLCVAIFRHLQGKLLDEHTDLVKLLLCEPLLVNIGDFIPFMEHLEHIYRPFVKQHMK